ncbi:DNA-binding FadR family transcriptional regulator [Novosphingobium chloroacetimidivorans]|uniref:DNA-binding FadR family transcriptional regulator n=1 Tax=Novosphingobium chloroacetimidivorans TaxID=1428314 RepID=A0A7W7KB23_9SPHN|nr:FadR/GntR family transcriptional regulator [Novosphingobium chloroacetimidivorans]MBB4859201.1 DNA-binding FadR family transcriptional regulator [Novosphingobium chloroacetimidivorans]
MAKRGDEKAERLHQLIARQIGTAILSGKYEPGAPFDGEIEQSAALGVSRTAYREAMRILISKGMVESRPKAGTHVTDRAKWNLLDPEMLAWMFGQEPDERFVRDLFELRGVLEPAAAELAAMRRTPEQLAAMAECVGTMARVGLARDAGQEADRQFHRVLLEATENEAFMSLSGSIEAAVQWTTRFKQMARFSPRDPVPDHQAVYDAIARGDARAAGEAMRVLLNLALGDMGRAA